DVVAIERQKSPQSLAYDRLVVDDQNRCAHTPPGARPKSAYSDRVLGSAEGTSERWAEARGGARFRAVVVLSREKPRRASVARVRTTARSRPALFSDYASRRSGIPLAAPPSVVVSFALSVGDSRSENGADHGQEAGQADTRDRRRRVTRNLANDQRTVPRPRPRRARWGRCRRAHWRADRRRAGDVRRRPRRFLRGGGRCRRRRPAAPFRLVRRLPRPARCGRHQPGREP